MRSDSPFFQIMSLLLMFGPIVLFWYIDWYWVVGYYNLFFAYTSYTLYKQYDNDSNYVRRYHMVIYVGLPLIFSFIGLLISVISGFEEIRDEDKNFNTDLTKKIDKNQIESKSDVHAKNKEFIENLGRLYNTLDKDKYQKEAFKRWRDFFEKQLDLFFSDWEEDGSFHDDYDLLISEKDDYYIESFYNTHEFKNDKIEIVDFLIRNRNVEVELDHLPIILPVTFFNEEPFIIYNFPYNYDDSSNYIGNHFSFYIDGGLHEVCEKLSKLKMKDFLE